MGIKILIVDTIRYKRTEKRKQKRIKRRKRRVRTKKTETSRQRGAKEPVKIKKLIEMTKLSMVIESRMTEPEFEKPEETA